jgi:cell wall-associated NlpC family hydrolase
MIPEWVGAYIGIPFKDRGRTREGADCWGVVRMVFADQFGIDLPSYDANYEKAGDRFAVTELFFQETTSTRWRRVMLGEAVPHDVLRMSVAGNSHAGILVAPDRFLHVLPGRETCVERLKQWEPRITAVYRNEALVIA